MAGQIRFRIRFSRAIGPWFDYLLVSPDEIREIIATTPWQIEKLFEGEGSDFIANAALSRDAGMSSEAFIGRMEEDFVAIQGFPSELRWFVHDSDDEAFLLESAREVFAHPGAAKSHRQTFLQACVERMAV